MTPRRVRFTATAQGHVDRERQWWIKHRVHVDVFADEFEQALKVLTILPGAGSVYAQAGAPGLRRVYVPKVACHLYYTFDDAEVIVRAFWGARCGHGPRL